MENAPGTLYLCATPIGNLEDITLRVIRVLKEVDQVWAEDTRRTLQLLNHLQIQKKLLSCHEHNEKARAEELVGLLAVGQSIAYCSDAGMPGISDPGAVLLAHCRETGMPATVLPGASAVLMAAVLCGIPHTGFTFFGFLPREKKQRQAMLPRIAACEELVLLYESPLRLPATLKELVEILGGSRRAAVLRELTKLHEECATGTLAELAAHFLEAPKGECVIAIAGKLPESTQVEAGEVEAAIAKLLAEGFSTKDAATAAAVLYNIPKNKAYQQALVCAKEL